MTSRTKILFIAIMVVAAVFLSGCTDSNSADQSSSDSGQVTEKVNPVTETANNTNDKKMSVKEDIETNVTTVNSSLNTTTTTNTTTYSTYYSSEVVQKRVAAAPQVMAPTLIQKTVQ